MNPRAELARLCAEAQLLSAHADSLREQVNLILPSIQLLDTSVAHLTLAITALRSSLETERLGEN